METATLALPLKEFTPFPTDKTPDAFTVRRLKKEVVQCAIAIPSDLGGGAHGLLGLVIPAADYATIVPATPFVRPAAPAPLNVQHNAGPAVVAMRVNQYETNLRTFRQCNELNSTLKKMILQAVPNIYLDTIADDTYGYANVTAEAMLTHLMTTYGTISEDDLAKNLEEMEAPWDPSTPIESIFTRANTCRQFATAGSDAISDANTVRLVLKAFEKSGVLEDACRDWRKKTAANRTWANLPAHFKLYNKERLRTITAAEAGYNAANAAQENTTQTSTNTNFTTDINGTKFSYCWSHGLIRNLSHNSSTCNAKAEGHKDDATAANMQGGNNRVRRQRGEQQVFRPRNTT